MSAEVTRETLDAALDAARRAPGNTLLVLVSTRQAERLQLALKIAGQAHRVRSILGVEFADDVARYEELSK